jgi:NUMOD4 motif/AP2 domain
VEKWLPVTGFPAYEVSDLGRVKRVVGVPGVSAGKILKPLPDKDNYLRVNLHRGDGKSHHRSVHRLVAVAFIPNPLNLSEVNHTGAGVKSDNRACKLEWRSRTGHGQDRAKRHQQGNGVCFDQHAGKWQAYYNPTTNKQVSLGTAFPTYEAAKAAREAAVAGMPYRAHRIVAAKTKRKLPARLRA